MIEKTAFIVKYIVLEFHNPLIWRSLADTQKTNKLFGRSMFDETDKKEITYQNAKNIRNTPNKSALMYQPITNY